MKSIKYLCLLSNIFLQWVVTGADNPKPCAALVGCKCLVSDSAVSCNLGTTDATLRTSFDLIEKKIVESFELSESTNITKITDYFSRNVSFVNIHIRNAKSLTTIEENAFWSSVNTTKSFQMVSTSLNSSESLFRAISRLNLLSELTLDDNQLDFIPDHAFGVNQKHLTLISISRNRIKKLGQFAFFSLPYLDFLDLSNNLLEELGNNSFAIQKPNDRKDSLLPHIRINLQSNHIKVISDHAFDKLSRPTALDISFNNLTELRPNVFMPLLPFDMTKIRVKGNMVKCDCGINWIYENKTISSKFSGPLRCADKRYFEDLTDKDFKNCTKFYDFDEYE